MMMKCALFLGCLVASLLPDSGWAFIGEPAPRLTVAAWAKGGPVEIKPGTNIFVVEIWQTGIKSAHESVLVFSELQKQYRTNGVVVVGICDESVERLNDFLQIEGTNVAYAVAADTNHQTSFAYMRPIAQRGIPYAFIVGTNGTVLWHGWSPYDLVQSLERIVAGQFDLKRAKEIETANYQMQQYVDFLRTGDRRTGATGRTLLANRTNDVVMLCDLAREIVSLPPGLKRDYALADEALTQAEKAATTNLDRIAYVRALWLFESGHPEEGIARGEQALAAAQDSQDKKLIEAGLHRMRERLAAGKNRQPAAKPSSGTNAPSGGPGDQAPGIPAKP